MLNVDISSRSFEQLLVFVTPKDRGDCQLHLSFCKAGQTTSVTERVSKNDKTLLHANTLPRPLGKRNKISIERWSAFRMFHQPAFRLELVCFGEDGFVLVDVDRCHAYWGLNYCLLVGRDSKRYGELTPAGISYWWNVMLSVG